MLSHIKIPREDHLNQVFHMFLYLRLHNNTKMVLYISDPVIDESKYEIKYWNYSEFGHIQGKDKFPLNMIELQGRGFVMRANVNIDHASDIVTKRSRTCLLVFLNSAPIY